MVKTSLGLWRPRRLGTRRHIGLARAAGAGGRKFGYSVVPGRAAFGHVAVLVKGGFALASVYLVTTTGFGPENLGILRDLGVALLDCGLPFVIGGDFEVDPRVLMETGWLAAISATIIAPKELTCTAGEGATIDYFVVSDQLVPKVRGVDVLFGLGVRPHRGVRLEFEKSRGQESILVQKKCWVFPNTLPYGPRRQPLGRRDRGQRLQGLGKRG